jgi:hypothetical protein
MTMPHSTDTNCVEPDYNYLLQSNLERVFNEQNAEKRGIAISALFAPEATLYEPAGIVIGHVAISSVAGALLAKYGPDFSFKAQDIAVGHHGLGCLRWQAGLKGGPTIVTGTDVAEIVDEQIVRLWVLIDSPPSG